MNRNWQDDQVLWPSFSILLLRFYTCVLLYISRGLIASEVLFDFSVLSRGGGAVSSSRNASRHMQIISPFSGWSDDNGRLTNHAHSMLPCFLLGVSPLAFHYS